MARQKNNIVMRSTRGMVGKQIVFKQRAGKAYVAAPPDVNENRIPTPAQLLAQERFRKSAAYSAIAMEDPIAKAQYKAKARRGQSPSNVAFKDAYAAPEVVGIISAGYTGLVGSLIVVQATDDFEVDTVNVQVLSASDELIEEGPATPAGDGLNWNYLATVLNPAVSGCQIKALAYDKPMNEGTLIVTLP